MKLSYCLSCGGQHSKPPSASHCLRTLKQPPFPPHCLYHKVLKLVCDSSGCSSLLFLCACTSSTFLCNTQICQSPPRWVTKRPGPGRYNFYSLSLCVMSIERGLCLLSQSRMNPTRHLNKSLLGLVLFHPRAADWGISKGGRKRTVHFLLPRFSSLSVFTQRLQLVSFLSHV